MHLDSIFVKRKYNEAFSKYNIYVPENFEFSNINIIIGPNGAGKTRFLNAIKELYNDRDVRPIYSFFPALPSHMAPQKHSMPDYSIIEVPSNENDIGFADFFREIESQFYWTLQTLSNPQSKKDKIEKEKLFNTIKDIFSKFTQKELIRVGRKYSLKTFDNEPLALTDELNRMSPGERVLLYMSVFIALQKKNKKRQVIILDEPESHLHPKALIAFINLLKEQINDNNMVCWIATHSLFLIPEFEFKNIVCIKNSQIQNRTSQLYHNMFSDMLGDEDGKVKTFFSSLPYWQYSDFICECFTPPTVIETVNPEDEQVRLFKEYLNGDEERAFRVLDWGGGRGRLGSSLEAAWAEKRPDFCYEIYEPNPVYKGDKFKVYTDLKDIKGPYDCIVMMNVLHEIDPLKWCDLFSNIHHFLKEDAYVFFVEVKALSQGEMPIEEGYFVLGKSELEILFQNKELTDFTLKDNAKREQKSSCIIIPQKSLLNIRKRTILEAIYHLRDRMLDEIEKCRNTNKTDKPITGGAIGRKYAFLLQQHMNATLFLKQNTKKTSHFSELQMKLANVVTEYDKVSCYGGNNVKWKGIKALSDELYKKIKDSARSFSTLYYNNREYLFINLCEHHTSRDDIVIVFDSLESIVEFSVDISDVYFERVYSLHHDNSQSFLDEKMTLNVHMHFNSNIVSVPIAYACYYNESTSVALSNVVSNSDAQNKTIDLIETPSEVGSIIGFSETAYCIRCVTATGDEFYCTLYMANKNGDFQYKLSQGEDDYKKHYEAARQNMKKEIQITQKYN